MAEKGRLLSVQQVDSLIERIMLLGKNQRFTKLIEADEIRALCFTVMGVLQKQPAMVEIQPPVVICGDIHGQFADLMRIFLHVGFPPARNYLFLGDYVDRGKQSLETAVLLFCYKVRYPENFFLLRGNHECSNINKVYGFYDEIQKRYPIGAYALWNLFNQTFAWMPYSALVGGRILCMHGGISDRLRSLQQLRELRRPMLDFDARNPTIELDLLWADPELGVRGCLPSTRGASVMFGDDLIVSMCQRLDIDLIVRAHQVVQDGAEFFGSGQLITLFSAPHYAGQYNNSGAAMAVDENLCCSFYAFNPQDGGTQTAHHH